MHLADADGAAEVSGLDEDGIGEGLFDEADGAFGVGAPLAAQQRDVRRLWQAGGGEETLHGVLIHGGGGAEDAGADVGDVRELEESLDGAIFAEGAVQDGKDDIERLSERVGGLGEFSAGVDFKRVMRRWMRVRGRRDVERLAGAKDRGSRGELHVGLRWCFDGG